MYLLRYIITLKRAFYINKGIISDKFQNMSDKQQRFFILQANPITMILHEKLHNYLKEGWFIVSTTSSKDAFFIVIEKDFTLK